jgi:release factor glutamine methyltransferase
MFYQIETDSKLLLKSVENYLEKNKFEKISICEMGVGSGFIILEIAKKFKNKKIDLTGFDINKKAIENTQKQFKKYNLKGNFQISNLFETSITNKKFDLIFFNTPYLPCEENEKFEDLKIIDKAIYGGKEGYEITIKFLEKLNNKLNKKGVCFILISTLTKPKIIEKKLIELNFKFQIMNRKKEFFEELLVYKIEKKLSNTT